MPETIVKPAKPVRSEYLKIRLTPAEQELVERLVKLSDQPHAAAYLRSLIYRDARARNVRWDATK